MPFRITPREKRFIRYSSVGFLTFCIDLLLLLFLTAYLKVPYLPATAGSFLIAVSGNYLISRRYVFRHTKRGMHAGYIYFLQFALLGMAVTTGLMWLLLSLAPLPVLYARVIIAAFVGIGNYLANLHLTFRVAGKHGPH